MQNIRIEGESEAGRLQRLDERADEVRQHMEAAADSEIAGLWAQLDISGIYHDCALEGQVISPEELNAAFDSQTITDATTLSLYTSLRNHRKAFDLMRELAARSRLDLNIELFKQFHALFAPDPEEGKLGRYRKDIPLHRSYFHEINEPTKISQNVRQLVTWLNNPAEVGGLHPVICAARFHYKFMRIFPFSDTSGKVGRAVMNLILIREGYLPAIIHATERQRYYELLRQQQEGFAELIIDSAMASLDAAIRFLTRG
jgi:Fic family protein